MTVLYRRFFLITVLITAFAGIFANIILHTRSDRTHMHIVQATPFSVFKITPLSSSLPIRMFERACSNDNSCPARQLIKINVR